MDGRRFDDVARSLASGVSRRGFLHRVTAGAVAGLVAAVPGTDVLAATCKVSGKVCAADGDCCSGLVCHSRRCRAGCRIGGTFQAPGVHNPSNICQSCRPKLSTKAFSNVKDGSPCSDGKHCTTADVCRSGQCRGVPVICSTTEHRPCQTYVCSESSGGCEWKVTHGGYCDPGGTYCYC
jgi:hypothetical protein